jgi:undecaprenyl diphosphate synthase
LVEAARRAGSHATREAIAAALPAPDVDLVIRTSGEQRLSDFLLWESAYAELIFLEVHWPDFAAEHLQHAIATFHSRDRRFGAVPAA